MIFGFPKFPRICSRFCLLILYSNIRLIVLYQFGIWCCKSFFWSVFSHIQSKCGKIRARKSSVFRHFSRSGNLIGLFFAELTQSKKSCLFLLVSKRDHLRTDISLWMHFRSDPWVFLEKSILKICSKFTREHRCQSVISMKLLYSFPDHLFIRKLMEGCFFHFDYASLIHFRSVHPF